MIKKPMLAITIWQPHATLIILGLKPFETRFWVPRWNGEPYRGEIAIHAGTRTDDLESLVARTRALKAQGQWPPKQGEGFLSTFHLAMNVYLEHAKIEGFTYNDFPRGAIIGTARIDAVYDGAKLYPKLKWPECDFGDFSQGSYAWSLKDIKPLPEPIPARGGKGLWEWNPAA